MIKFRNPMLLDLIIGNMLYGLFGEIIIIIFLDEKIYISIGFIVGILLSCFMVIHMEQTIHTAMYMGGNGAPNKLRFGYFIRMFTIILFIGILHFFNLGNILALLIGIMSLKVSAYIQPFTHKYISTKINQ